jgi:hypothetical protein
VRFVGADIDAWLEAQRLAWAPGHRGYPRPSLSVLLKPKGVTMPGWILERELTDGTAVLATAPLPSASQGMDHLPRGRPLRTRLLDPDPRVPSPSLHEPPRRSPTSRTRARPSSGATTARRSGFVATPSSAPTRMCRPSTRTGSPAFPTTIRGYANGQRPPRYPTPHPLRRHRRHLGAPRRHLVDGPRRFRRIQGARLHVPGVAG